MFGLSELNRCIGFAESTLDLGDYISNYLNLLRKEVIQSQVPLRLPCYDFTPITGHTLGGCLLAVSSPTSGITGFRGVTGGVYKARERIHRAVMMRDY